MHARAPALAGGNAFGGIGCKHMHARLSCHNAGVFGSSRKRLLKRNRFVGKAELHGFTRTAIGNGKDNRAAIVYHLLNARQETRIRTSDSGLLDLELGRHRAAGADKRNIVQTLLMTKVELLGAHVEPVEL